MQVSIWPMSAVIGDGTSPVGLTKDCGRSIGECRLSRRFLEVRTWPQVAIPARRFHSRFRMARDVRSADLDGSQEGSAPSVGDELEHVAVDAVALVAGQWAVFEDVAEMDAGTGAAHFDALHALALVVMQGDGAG